MFVLILAVFLSAGWVSHLLASFLQFWLILLPKYILFILLPLSLPF